MLSMCYAGAQIRQHTTAASPGLSPASSSDATGITSVRGGRVLHAPVCVPYWASCTTDYMNT